MTLVNLFRSENTMACLCFGSCILLGFLCRPRDLWEVSVWTFPYEYLAPFLSPLVFFVVRATNQEWRRDYEIDKYLRRKSTGTRNRWRKRLPWISVAVGAFLVFFFPLASRVVYLFSGSLGQHRISIPWTYLVLREPHDFSDFEAVRCLVPKSKWGMTPDPLRVTYTSYRSAMNFVSVMVPEGVSLSTESAPESVRKFDIGNGQILACNEILSEHFVAAHCGTPAIPHRRRLWANFSGEPRDLADFYRILETNSWNRQ